MDSPDSYRILLVEDDPALAAMVADFLQLQGLCVAVESNGQRAVTRILDEAPDAVLLDINLPGLDGISVCRSVRANYAGAIIMLTARGGEIDEVLGFEAGADDYIAKPIRPRALIARLRTHLRRESPGIVAADPIRVGGLLVDPRRRLVEWHDADLELTTAEFDLLFLLAQHAGQPLSRKQIYQEIHGLRYDGLDRSIDLRISRLRKKLGDDSATPQLIKSVRGVGYLLSVES